METEKPDAQPERKTGKTEEQGGESQKGPAAPPPVAEPSHSEAKGRDAEEGKDETDREQDEAIDKLAENTELIAQQTKWERMQGVWVRNQFWASLGLGLLTLLLLGYQTYTLSGQLEAMQSSSEQTQEMIRAMQKQADAAVTQANTSQSIAKQNEELVRHAGEQADALKASLEETRKAANAATTQAAASQAQADASVAQAEVAKQALGAAASSARATEESARIARQSYEVSQRPIVFFKNCRWREKPTSNKPLLTEFVVANNGATAYGLFTQMNIGVVPKDFDRTLPCNPAIDSAPAPLERGADQTYRPGFVMMLTEEGIKKVEDESMLVLFYGHVWYEDGTGQKYDIPYCRYYDKLTYPDLAVCPSRLKVPDCTGH